LPAHAGAWVQGDSSVKYKPYGARYKPAYPELHIGVDRLTPYENIAKVMALAAKNGLVRIGFVSDPSVQ